MIRHYPRLDALVRAGRVRRIGPSMFETVHEPRVERKPRHLRTGRRIRPTMTTALHARFVASLGPGRIGRYSDGGPTDRGRALRRTANRAARQARRRNR